MKTWMKLQLKKEKHKVGEGMERGEISMGGSVQMATRKTEVTVVPQAKIQGMEVEATIKAVEEVVVGRIHWSLRMKPALKQLLLHKHLLQMLLS